jgi:hypothetical protein
LPFKKIGDDVTAQKPMTSPKQVVQHRMAIFKTKSTHPSNPPKNITQRCHESRSKPYVHTVYKSKALNHRQFKQLLEELETEYGDLVYYCKVRWLSKGNMLKRFFELKEE